MTGRGDQCASDETFGKARSPGNEAATDGYVGAELSFVSIPLWLTRRHNLFYDADTACFDNFIAIETRSCVMF